MLWEFGESLPILSVLSEPQINEVMKSGSLGKVNQSKELLRKDPDN